MERINDILGYKDLKIFQDSEFFSFSLDSIILANYSNIRLRDKNIVDFCTGNAVVPLILSRRCSKNIDAIEIQKPVYELAKKSVDINNLDNRINLLCMDVNDFSNISSNLNKYDLVLCNPPYFKNNDNSTKNDSSIKSIARHELLFDLDSLCRCASRILKDHGNLFIVHRSDRLMDIIFTMKKYNLEPKGIKFIYEKLSKESYLVLVEAQKCGNSGLKVYSPLVMYNENGSMTFEYDLLQKEVRK